MNRVLVGVFLLFCPVFPLVFLVFFLLSSLSLGSRALSSNLRAVISLAAAGPRGACSPARATKRLRFQPNKRMLSNVDSGLPLRSVHAHFHVSALVFPLSYVVALAAASRFDILCSPWVSLRQNVFLPPRGAQTMAPLKRPVRWSSLPSPPSACALCQGTEVGQSIQGRVAHNNETKWPEFAVAAEMELLNSLPGLVGSTTSAQSEVR